MLRIFLLVFFWFQTISIANEINLEDPFYKLGWKNLQNPKTSIVSIPNTNATLEILKSEIYLDQKENIKNYLEYQKGIEVNIDDREEVFIISDNERYYNVEITYTDSGYINTDRFKNFTPKDIMNTMKQNKPESVSDINWVLEPGLSEEKISTYGYRIDWMDGDVSYEYEGIVLGRNGYLKITFATNGDGNESEDFFDYYNSIINGVSDSIVFDEGFSYTDLIIDDYQSVYTLTNIIDGSFGIGNSTDPTIETVNCLVTTGALKKGGITEVDYPRFAGKVIELRIFDLKKEIADFSIDDEVNVLSGMYGPQQRQKYNRNGNLLTYTNIIELSGDTEKDKVKYEYNNKILFENNKPIEFKAFIDQTGLSFNKWTLTFDCRDYDYTDDEIAKAGEFSVKPELKDLIKKLEKRKKNN
tara:strand:- start:209 stop:1450 length:1242 start_codon:yes stop_codon:yes gene_type:complete